MSHKQIMSDEEIVELVETCESWAGRPVTTTTELAERLDVTRQAVHKRLTALHEEERVRKHKPGRAAIWWRNQNES